MPRGAPSTKILQSALAEGNGIALRPVPAKTRRKVAMMEEMFY